ncbi:hypothetical protein CF319_g5287 [Tilletia indica]|nr:hypothetical protein CF319_g5287 [Tilletia indica]
MRLKDQDTILMRYIGTFGSSSTAMERYKDDVRLRQRDAGVLAAFLRSLESMMPDVLRALRIFGLPTTRLRPAATRHVSDLVHNKRRVRAIEPLKKFTHTTAFKPCYVRADPKFSFVLQKSSVRHTSLQNIKGSANPHAPRNAVAPSSGPMLDRLSSSSSGLHDQDSSTFNGAHALSNATELPSSPMLDQATSSDHHQGFSTSDGAHAISNAGAPSTLLLPRTSVFLAHGLRRHALGANTLCA